MNIPHFDQWLGEWAMEPERFLAIYQRLAGLDLHLHLQTGPDLAQQRAREQRQQMTTTAAASDGSQATLAVVPLHGMLMKSVPSGERGTSTALARRKIREAAADPNISATLLHIASPGGTVDGTFEIAADVAAAAKRKPVYAFIDGLGASAAYWIASQATQIFASQMAFVGSIGTYGVVYDTSGKAAMQGVKVHVVRAGEMKGQGEPGTPVSAELLGELQARINALNDFFVRGVATGRGFSQEKVRGLADGRIHIAADALAKGLIDGIATFDETITQLVAATSKTRSPRMDATIIDAVLTTSHPTEQAAAAAIAAAALAPAAAQVAAPAAQAVASQVATLGPRAATLAELKAACPSAGSDFLLAQLEAGATVATAQTAFVAALTKQNADLAKQLAEKPAPAAAATSSLGATEVIPAGSAAASSSAAGGDAISQWEEQLQSLMTDRKLTKAQAVRQLCLDNPELQAAYNAAYTQANASKVNRALAKAR
jgi:signal peptide peptidase SppA